MLKTHFAAALAIFGILLSGNVNGQTIIDASMDSGYFAAGFDMGVPAFTVNNFGGHTHLPTGRANSDRVNRSIFQFDILGNIPSGSTVMDATFEFEVTQQGGYQGTSAANFDLHRVTTAWDEGTGTGNIGQATGDGVTWANATATVEWNTLGGDFDSPPLGSVLVSGPNGNAGEAPILYQINSAALVSYVQDVVDGTAVDNGLLLKTATEAILGSASRVTSIEGGTPARLTVTLGGVILGDVNMDGTVNLLDVAPFVDLISRGIFQAEADINQDGVVTLLDVQPFVTILQGG